MQSTAFINILGTHSVSNNISSKVGHTIKTKIISTGEGMLGGLG